MKGLYIVTIVISILYVWMYIHITSEGEERLKRYEATSFKYKKLKCERFNGYMIGKECFRRCKTCGRY